MKPREIELTPVAHIHIGNRHRQLDPKKVEELADSIEEIGLQNPILVRDLDEAELDGEKVLNVPTVISGMHRLAAVKKLEWEKVETITVECGELVAELMEIDENLIRAELTEIERSRHLKRRKEIFEEKRQAEKLRQKIAEPSEEGGEIPSEPDLGGKKFPTKPQHEPGFAKDTAEKTGQSKRAINLSLSRGKKIADDVAEAIMGAEPDSPLGQQADSGTDLDALGTLDPDEQRQAVERLESGADQSFREARDFIQGDDEERRERQIQKEADRLWRTWHKACDEARKRFTGRFGKGVGDSPGEAQLYAMQATWLSADDQVRQRFGKWLEDKHELKLIKIPPVRRARR